jgi:hypothetical protein
MSAIHHLVKLRHTVVEGNLHGIVSLYALLGPEQATLERDPRRVLYSTYPSAAFERLIRRLRTSLSAEDADRKGNCVLGGGYGSGKSQLLLALYHLLIRNT